MIFIPVGRGLMKKHKKSLEFYVEFARFCALGVHFDVLLQFIMLEKEAGRSH